MPSQTTPSADATGKPSKRPQGRFFMDMARVGQDDAGFSPKMAMASPHRQGWNCPHPVAEYRLPPSQNARHTVAEVIKCRRRVKPPPSQSARLYRRRVRFFAVAE